MVQFKIVHRILATNRNLYKWKINADSRCTFCKQEDTIAHFLYECSAIHILWNSIFNWWNCSFNLNIPLSIHEILFGIPNLNDELIIVHYNYVLLYAKYYIYLFKKKGQILDFYEFMVNLKQELILKVITILLILILSIL